MKNLIITIIAVLFFAQNIFAQENLDPVLFFLPEGTPLQITSHVDIKAKHLKKGQQICLYVIEDLIDEQNEIVIPKGTSVYFKILKKKRPRGFGKAGKLEIEAQYLQLFDGQQIALFPQKLIVEGRDKSIEAEDAMVVTSASSELFYQQNMVNAGQAVEVLAPLAAIFVKGKHALIQKGIIIDVFVRKDTPLLIAQN